MDTVDRECIDDQLRKLKPESITLWNDELEENYTLNFMLDMPQWKRDYEKLIHEFSNEGDNLYIYPFERLHMTLLGRIDKKIDKKLISETIKSEMKGKSFSFNVGYLQCSNASVGILAVPSFDLHQLREKLRFKLGIEKDERTRYSDIYEKLAWINIIRFSRKPNYVFFETLWNMRNYQFGLFEAKNIDILWNKSRILDPKKCSLVERIEF